MEARKPKNEKILEFPIQKLNNRGVRYSTILLSNVMSLFPLNSRHNDDRHSYQARYDVHQHYTLLLDRTNSALR